jgi:hypothetical protein
MNEPYQLVAVLAFAMSAESLLLKDAACWHETCQSQQQGTSAYHLYAVVGLKRRLSTSICCVPLIALKYGHIILLLRR